MAGQGVGFQMEEELSVGLGGYLHFWSKKSRPDRTWDGVHLNRSCLLGNRRVTLWCSLSVSHYSKVENSAMHICCCSDTFQYRRATFENPAQLLERWERRKGNEIICEYSHAVWEIVFTYIHKVRSHEQSLSLLPSPLTMQGQWDPYLCPLT